MIASEERSEDHIIRLEKLPADFKRALYGAKAEKYPPDCYHLALKDIERTMAVVHAKDEAIDPPKTIGASKPRAGRGSERHIIGEDASDRLNIVPEQFRVIVTRCRKYACRPCEAGVMQAPARPQLVESGMPTEATVTGVIISRYADHLPVC